MVSLQIDTNEASLVRSARQRGLRLGVALTNQSAAGEVGPNEGAIGRSNEVYIIIYMGEDGYTGDGLISS